MRFLPGLMFVACATCVFAQAEDPPEVLRAKAGIELLRSLVDAGVAPRVQLVQAEAAIADAEDEALLRRTVYGNELSEDQVDEMLAAAARRLDRRQQALDTGRNLVDGGVAALASLTPLLEELDAARPLLYIGPPVRLNCMNSRLQYHQPWHGRSALCAWPHAGSVGWNGGHRGIPCMLLLYAAPGVESVRIRLSGLSTRNRHLLKHARIDPALSRSV